MAGVNPVMPTNYLDVNGGNECTVGAFLSQPGHYAGADYLSSSNRRPMQTAVPEFEGNPRNSVKRNRR
jgi:hypothetical protein